MTTTNPTRHDWQAFADATLDHDPRARQMGRELATSTPPVALAKRARHRKPNRRPSVIRKVLGVSLFVAALFAGTAAAAPGHGTPAFTPAQFSRQASQVATILEAPGYQLESYVTATIGQEAAACSAVYHFARVNARDHGNEAAWQAAWHHAMHAAMHADPEMRADIRRYLATERGWILVRSDCNPDEGL